MWTNLCFDYTNDHVTLTKLQEGKTAKFVVYSHVVLKRKKNLKKIFLLLN